MVRRRVRVHNLGAVSSVGYRAIRRWELSKASPEYLTFPYRFGNLKLLGYRDGGRVLFLRCERPHAG
jgi:hypothetical protein